MKITVGGIPYELVRSEDTEDCGEFFARKEKLVISKELPPHSAWNAIYHELGHALVYLHGLDKQERFDEEFFCNAFSLFVTQLLLNNPSLAHPTKFAKEAGIKDEGKNS